MPQESDGPAQEAKPAEREADCAHHRPVRLSWAKLLKRVFEIAMEHGPNCGSELMIIAAIPEQPERWSRLEPRVCGTDGNGLATRGNPQIAPEKDESRRRCYRSTELSHLQNRLTERRVPCSGCHGEGKSAFENPILPDHSAPKAVTAALKTSDTISRNAMPRIMPNDSKRVRTSLHRPPVRSRVGARQMRSSASCNSPNTLGA